jgi:hypothetical protein
MTHRGPGFWGAGIVQECVSRRIGNLRRHANLPRRRGWVAIRLRSRLERRHDGGMWGAETTVSRGAAGSLKHAAPRQTLTLLRVRNSRRWVEFPPRTGLALLALTRYLVRRRWTIEFAMFWNTCCRLLALAVLENPVLPAQAASWVLFAPSVARPIV